MRGINRQKCRAAAGPAAARLRCGGPWRRIRRSSTAARVNTSSAAWWPTSGGFDLAAPEAADAVAHINDLLRVDGGIVTPIYYWTCINKNSTVASFRDLESSSPPARTLRSGLLFVAASTRCFSAW